MGIILNLNHWMAKVSFSQRIPYKIDMIERVTTPEETQIPTSEKAHKQKLYGGGEFNLSIIRCLDQ